MMKNKLQQDIENIMLDFARNENSNGDTMQAREEYYKQIGKVIFKLFSEVHINMIRIDELMKEGEIPAVMYETGKNIILVDSIMKEINDVIYWRD